MTTQFAKLFNASFVNDIYATDFPQGADVAISEAKNAISAADAKGDGKTKVAGLLRMADVHLKKKESEKVEELLDEAGKLSRRLKFDEGKAYMLIMQAKLELWYGTAEEAVSWSRDAVKLFRKLGNDRAIAFSSNMHAFVLASAGKPQEGMQCAKEALMLYKQLGEQTLEVGVLRLLMDMFVNAGDTLRAGLVGWEIVKVVTDSGGEKKHKVSLAEIMQRIASIEFQGNDLDKAMSAASDACTRFQQAGNADGEAAVMKTMVDVYIKQDKFYEAVEVAKEIVELYRSTGGEDKALGNALLDLADVWMRNDCTAEATDAAGQALTAFTRGKYDTGITAANQMLKNLDAAQKKQNIKFVLELNRSRLGHIPTNLIIAPDGMDIDAFNGLKQK
jgi:tetratricopeptide (TPR) repeat protein